MRCTLALAMIAGALLPSGARADVIDADPTTIESLLPTLSAGDVLRLAPGTYEGRLRLTGLHGTEASPIVIEGPSDLGAIVEAYSASCCNMVELRDVQHVVLRRLVFDGRSMDGVFGVSAGTTPAPNVVHHVTVEDSVFRNFDGSINHDPISTKTSTWGWVLRRNVFERCGPVYLGNSTGDHPFMHGLIEHNAFVECVGYCMQIKWQLARDAAGFPGYPTAPGRTIIRHNVFSHADDAAYDARPSLLVGGFPGSGLGSEDVYEIYGNLFVHNDREALFQGSGRVSLHDNVFVDAAPSFAAIVLRDHDLPLRRAWVYRNTIYTSGRAIQLGSADQGSVSIGNAIFSGAGVSGTFDTDRDNVIGALAEAPTYVAGPGLDLASVDLHPSGDALRGTALDLSALTGDTDAALDFECRERAGEWRGAYEGPAGAIAWDLGLEIKPDLCGAIPPTDGGVTSDAGASGDAGARRDAGEPMTDGGPGAAAASCGCRAVASSRSHLAMALVLLLLAVRRRARARRG